MGGVQQKARKGVPAFLPFAFLIHATVMPTMFMTAGGRWLREQLTFLEQTIPSDRLRTLLEEDYVGEPLLSSAKYLTSHDSIHTLYHLVRFFETIRCDLS
jgi:hypothetical protein